MTLTPAMGRYLDMVNNGKPDAERRQPNENYARELLQLFTIGAVRAEPDGTRSSTPRATRSPPTTRSRSRASRTSSPAGPTRRCRAQPSRQQSAHFVGRWCSVPATTTRREGTLLDGAALPGGLASKTNSPRRSDNIFVHPNVGPSSARQLIQKLVTGDPSPQYVARVAAAFDDNGAGVRGDMKAVVARHPARPGGARRPQARSGLRQAARARAVRDHLPRALGAQPATASASRPDAAAGSAAVLPPSVFNFYPPDYVVPHEALRPGVRASTHEHALDRVNFVEQLVFGNGSRRRDRDRRHRHAARTRPLQALAADPARWSTGSMAAAPRHDVGARRRRRSCRGDAVGDQLTRRTDRVLPGGTSSAIPGGALRMDRRELARSRREFLRAGPAVALAARLRARPRPARARSRTPRRRRRPTTRRWSASSCSAATTATTCSCRSTTPATRIRRRARGGSGSSSR